MSGAKATITYGLHQYRTGTTFNYSMSKDPRIDALALDVSANHWDDVRRDQLVKELIPYVYEQNYSMLLPVPYGYTFWQPWVKAYTGEIKVGRAQDYNFTHWIWLDQELKQAMTERR